MRTASDQLHGERNGTPRPYQTSCRRDVAHLQRSADFSARIAFETPPALRSASLLRQPLADPNEGCRHRCGVAPFALAIAVGEIEGQRRRVGVDDDLGPAESARGLFRELQQNAAVALPLEIAADGDEAKARLVVADKVDAHRSYDLAVAEEHVRKMAVLEFIRVVLVISLTRQQSGEDRVPANGVIGAPLPRRLYRPQRITCERISHRRLCRISFAIASIGCRA